jgi:exodeoxyribonuclease VII small subunit
MNKKLELIDLEKMTYEEAYNELVTVVDALESEEHTLDESMSLFERGQALSKHCVRLLETAELKVQQLSGENLVDLDIE